MANRFAVPAVLAVLAVSALAAPAVASADSTTQATLPISFTGWSQCPELTGEQVAWEGVMHVTYSLTANPASGLHELSHANIHMAGVGLTTGDRYVANGVSNIGETYPAGSRAIVIDVEHFHSIHPGETLSEDDYTSRIHLTRERFVEQEGCS